MERKKRFQPKKNNKKRILIIGAALLAVATVVVALELTNTTYFFHKRPPATTASQDTKGEVASSSSKSSSSSSKGSSSSGKSESSSATGSDDKDDSATTAVLLAPTGDFVSNHHPNLSGSPAPSQIASVCTTTPGATCVISFSKDNVTKSLASEVADSGGSAYWDWKLQDIGLTAGSWQITATATLNGQTKSATDALKLEVSE